MKYFLAGFIFSALWASASAFTKWGILSAEPFVIADTRFLIAGVIMLLWAHLLRGYPLPPRSAYVPLSIYGFLNITAYLGLFAVAIQYISAGIGTLAVATNPLFISIISAIWLGRRIKAIEWVALILGLVGVGIATYPLLSNSYATPKGLMIIFLSMLSYSIGTVYYSSREWHLKILTINGWQVLFGGIWLLPFTLIFSNFNKNTFDARFVITVVWLIVFVSVAAVQLWLYLLKIDTVKAAMWLFLCPIFGFMYAHFFLGEPISVYTYVGTALVLVGLYLGQRGLFFKTNSRNQNAF